MLAVCRCDFEAADETGAVACRAIAQGRTTAIG